MDKFAFLAWHNFLLGLFFTAIVLLGIYFATGIMSFVVWDLDFIRLFLSWGVIRFSLILSFFFSFCLVVSEGSGVYDKHVPKGDWLKNGKWF